MRSKVTRRMSCARAAGAAGSRPAASSLASTKASIAVLIHAAFLTRGGSSRTGVFHAQWFFFTGEKTASSARMADEVSSSNNRIDDTFTRNAQRRGPSFPP